MGPLLVPLVGGSSTSATPVAGQPTEPLTGYYDTLMHVGELVLASGFDAEEGFIRHRQQFLLTISAGDRRKVGYGVHPEIANAIHNRRCNRLPGQEPVVGIRKTFSVPR